MTQDPTKHPNFISGDRQNQQKPGLSREQLEKDGWRVKTPDDAKPQPEKKS